MVGTIKHKGLRRLYERGDTGKINPNHLAKVRLILADLDAADSIDHLRQPGYRLHELRGSLRGYFAVEVSGNWRIVFRFEGGVARDIDLADYDGEEFTPCP